LGRQHYTPVAEVQKPQAVEEAQLAFGCSMVYDAGMRAMA